MRRKQKKSSETKSWNFRYSKFGPHCLLTQGASLRCINILAQGYLSFIILIDVISLWPWSWPYGWRLWLKFGLENRKIITQVTNNKRLASRSTPVIYFMSALRSTPERPNPKKNMVYGTLMPWLTITSPYVDAGVDSITFTMDNPMPESALNPRQVTLGIGLADSVGFLSHC